MTFPSPWGTQGDGISISSCQHVPLVHMEVPTNYAQVVAKRRTSNDYAVSRLARLRIALCWLQYRNQREFAPRTITRNEHLSLYVRAGLQSLAQSHEFEWETSGKQSSVARSARCNRRRRHSLRVMLIVISSVARPARCNRRRRHLLGVLMIIGWQGSYSRENYLVV